MLVVTQPCALLNSTLCSAKLNLPKPIPLEADSQPRNPRDKDGDDGRGGVICVFLTLHLVFGHGIDANVKGDVMIPVGRVKMAMLVLPA